jgi:hypothetical protein
MVMGWQRIFKKKFRFSKRGLRPVIELDFLFTVIIFFSGQGVQKNYIQAANYFKNPEIFEMNIQYVFMEYVSSMEVG